MVRKRKGSARGNGHYWQFGMHCTCALAIGILQFALAVYSKQGLPYQSFVASIFYSHGITISRSKLLTHEERNN
jgi:hypothetical protein